MKGIIPSASVLSFAIALLVADVTVGAGAFTWMDKEDEYLDLLCDGKTITRYMYPHDAATEQRIFETYKPFHHVYDAEGNRLTNGPDGFSPHTKKGILYPRHRGIMIGCNKLMFEGSQYRAQNDVAAGGKEEKAKCLTGKRWRKNIWHTFIVRQLRYGGAKGADEATIWTLRLIVSREWI